MYRVPPGDACPDALRLVSRSALSSHVATDVVDGGVLAALLVAGPVTEPRFVDVSENSLYWYFIVLWWVPIYLTI